MATPSTNPIRTEPQKPYDSKNVEKSSSETPGNPQLEARLDLLIKVCKQERQERLSALNSMGEYIISQKLVDLEADLERLHPLFHQLLEIQKTSNDLTATFELKKPSQDLWRNARENIQILNLNPGC